jgi:hypothetical protein
MSLPSSSAHWSGRLSEPVRLLIQISKPILRVHFPDESSFRKGVIIGSSTFEKVNHLIEHSVNRYPMIHFRILVDDRNGANIAERWPNLDVKIFNRAIGRKEKFELITSLMNEHYDVCMILGAGDLHYDFLRGVGLISGAGYIKVFNELFSSFYCTAGQLDAILTHLLWRSKHLPISENTNVKIPLFRTGIGYLVSWIRVIPMLQSAHRLKNAKNPFLEE